MCPPVPSLHVAQGAVGGAHAGGAAACCSAVSANAGAAAFDLIRPAVGTGAVRHGQAGDGELDAVDGGAGHGRLRCALEFYRVEGRGSTLPAGVRSCLPRPSEPPAGRG